MTTVGKLGPHTKKKSIKYEVTLIDHGDQFPGPDMVDADWEILISNGWVQDRIIWDARSKIIESPTILAKRTLEKAMKHEVEHILNKKYMFDLEQTCPNNCHYCNEPRYELHIQSIR